MDKTYSNDDELLSAYIDGELSADDAAALVERLAGEPELVRRLEAMRSGDDAVRAAYAQLDNVPLPDNVMRQFDNVVTLPARSRPRFASLPVALAASVALVAGFLAVRQMQIDPQNDAVDALLAGRLEAGSQVYELLESGASGQREVLGEATEMRIIMSFESDGGDYCRQLYVAAVERSAHGVACRSASGWQLETVAVGKPRLPGGEFQVASIDTPQAVEAAVDRMIGAREPLSQQEEKVLISEGWEISEN